MQSMSNDDFLLARLDLFLASPRVRLALVLGLANPLPGPIARVVAAGKLTSPEELWESAVSTEMRRCKSVHNFTIATDVGYCAHMLP